MSKRALVSNLSRGFRLDLKQAARAVEVCAAVWVVPGESIRDVKLAESIALRNQQAARREALAWAELPGLMYEPTLRGAEGHRRERQLANAAARFAETACVTA